MLQKSPGTSEPVNWTTSRARPSRLAKLSEMMQASATALPVPGPPAFDRWIGRTHLHPAIDYLLVGGGVTIPIFIAIYFFPGLTAASTATSLNTFLVFNGAHFAASTVRL